MEGKELTSPFTPHSSRIRRVAFTLAEVLITLGIIGVVAALTMPTLISKYKDMVYENQRKAATSRISQALGMIYAKEELGTISSTNEMLNELTKQLKVLKVCQAGDISACFVDEITTDGNIQAEESQPPQPPQILSDLFMPPAYAAIGSASHDTQDKSQNKQSRDSLNLSLLVDNSSAANSELSGLVLADGTNMLFMYNPNCNYSGVNNGSSQSNGHDQNVHALSLLNSILGINPAYAAGDDATIQIINNTPAWVVAPASADQRACFGAIIDTNGNKSPNSVGKDVFLYQASLGGGFKLLE